MPDHLPEFDVAMWNRWTVSLGQACLGVISCNWRAIALSQVNTEPKATVYLAVDDTNDREEVVDMAAMFEAAEGVGCLTEVIVGREAIPLPSFPDRLVFARKEDVSESPEVDLATN